MGLSEKSGWGQKFSTLEPPAYWYNILLVAGYFLCRSYSAIMNSDLLLFVHAFIVQCSVVCQDRNACSNNGDCVLGVCQCDSGYTGTNCEIGKYEQLYTNGVMHSIVFNFLTATCFQQGTSECDERLIMTACRVMNETGRTLPQSCSRVINIHNQ